MFNSQLQLEDSENYKNKKYFSRIASVVLELRPVIKLPHDDNLCLGVATA